MTLPISLAGSKPSLGFTLVEILIVLTLLGGLTAIVLPRLDNAFKRQAVALAVARLGATLRSGHVRAMTTHNETSVLFDLERKQYRVSWNARTEALPVDCTYTLVSAKIASNGDHTAGFRFFPDGTSTGGSIKVVGDTGRYEIDLEWLTSEVAVNER